MVHLLKLCILSLLPVWEILCAARTHDLYTQHDEAEVATSACAPSCSLMHNQSKAWRIASLRVHILSELRLSHSPNVSSLVVPDAPPLRDLLQKHKFQENGRLSRSDTEEHPITEKIIILASKPDHEQLMSLKIKPKCCFFKINQDILSRIIVKADLWICLKPLRHDTDVTVRLTRLQHMGEGDLGRVRLRSINMRVTASDVTQWHSIDAKKLLQEELEHLQPKWGLEIHALDPEGQDVVITDQTQAGDERLKPFLDLEFAELQKQVKRSLGLDCTEASGEMQCCRYMLAVDFNAIGFDWVIAPKTYRAYYCTGLCNQMSLQRYPHTHLVSRVNTNGWGPCCSPTKMSAISMIYFNNQQNIMSSKISDMVVDRCGCS